KIEKLSADDGFSQDVETSCEKPSSAESFSILLSKSILVDGCLNTHLLLTFSAPWKMPQALTWIGSGEGGFTQPTT
ncbi:MAG: hypothetical protein AAFV25_28065, partial [Bacteroidota bacterium]